MSVEVDLVDNNSTFNRKSNIQTIHAIHISIQIRCVLPTSQYLSKSQILHLPLTLHITQALVQIVVCTFYQFICSCSLHYPCSNKNYRSVQRGITQRVQKKYLIDDTSKSFKIHRSLCNMHDIKKTFRMHNQTDIVLERRTNIWKCTTLSSLTHITG